MNVVLIGSGGREHALAYKLVDSEHLQQLFIIPGNPGTAQLGRNIQLNIEDGSSLINFCKQNEVELVVVGPEKPLVDGIADKLLRNSINVFGPNSDAAKIESEKTFAKKLMKKYDIPTADYLEFSSSQYTEALEYLREADYPKVIKADGLAAGKGVIVCQSLDEAEKAVNQIFSEKIFGKAGDKIVIEEFLFGQEASVFAVTDGKKFITLPPAQDHKRIGDNDTGKNTGGMGAYAPTPFLSKSMIKQIENNIISPTLKALSQEGKKFIGCLYCGLMLTNEGPKVIEFNCRFGDPETQAVLPLIEGDFLQLLYSAAAGSLDTNCIKYNGGSSVCIIAASKGYPDAYKSGYRISGIDSIDDPEVVIFHSGTKLDGNRLLTSGGRVIGVTSVICRNDIHEAQIKAYDALRRIHFENIYYRKDIAAKAILSS